ncbi:MAG: hypothetical protein JW885_11840 [Deltaproteobacteria bacterium]|nr:hypothetical protein [Candidatus Zymogenaceae bacterium]
MNRYFFVGFVLAVLLLPVMPAMAQDSSLTEDAIREAFALWEDETGEFTVIDPNEITWEIGSFTQADAVEAVVSFIDNGQAHVALPGELWLLEKNGVFTPLLMINQSDEITFQAIDVNNDGIDEVLYRATRSITGGLRFTNQSLVSLLDGEVRVLYTADGSDYWFYNEMMYSEDEPMIDHEITLEDIDDDGILELMDTELVGEFVPTDTGEEDYELRYTPEKTTVYRFIIDEGNTIVCIEEIPGQ